MDVEDGEEDADTRDGPGGQAELRGGLDLGHGGDGAVGGGDDDPVPGRRDAPWFAEEGGDGGSGGDTRDGAATGDQAEERGPGGDAGDDGPASGVHGGDGGADQLRDVPDRGSGRRGRGLCGRLCGH